MNKQEAMEKAREIVKNIISVGLLEDAGVTGDPQEIITASIRNVADALLTTHANAVRDEREACAKVAEEVRKRVTCPDIPRIAIYPDSQRIQRAIADAFEDGCDETASAIRQRGTE